MAAVVARTAQSDGVASPTALRCLSSNGSGRSSSNDGVEECIRGLQYDPEAAWQAAQA